MINLKPIIKANLKIDEGIAYTVVYLAMLRAMERIAEALVRLR